MAVARALCAAAGPRTLYVADLDALAGEPVDEAALAALAAVAEPWVDAGATTAEAAAALHRAGVARNVDRHGVARCRRAHRPAREPPDRRRS